MSTNAADVLNQTVDQTVEGLNQAAAGTKTFVERVVDELWRSLAETFGVLNRQEDSIGFSATFADWLTKVIVSALIVLIIWLGYWLARRVLRAVVDRFDTISAEIKRPLYAGLRYIFFLLGVLGVLSQFGVPPEFLRSVAVAAIMAFGFYIGWLILQKILNNTFKNYNIDRSLEQLARNVIGVIILAFAFVTVLSQFGINVVSVLAGLGVVGIAVGFAAQETLSNFISGITLLIERPFRIGDWVDLNGQTGKVEEITLRTTRVRTRDNAMISIPNASVASSDITNFSAGGPLRLQLPIGIAYKESAKKAREVMLPILNAHPDVLKTAAYTPQILVTELADSSVNLSLRAWISANDIAKQPGISAALLEACKEALDDAGIEIPFPHMQLFVDDAKGLEKFLIPQKPAP